MTPQDAAAEEAQTREESLSRRRRRWIIAAILTAANCLWLERRHRRHRAWPPGPPPAGSFSAAAVPAVEPAAGAAAAAFAEPVAAPAARADAGAERRRDGPPARTFGGKGPDFAAYRAAYPIHTAAYRAVPSGASPELSRPRAGAIIFDRRTETDDVVIYWRARDASQAEMERNAFDTQTLIACLKEYFGVRPLSAKVAIFYRREAGSGGATPLVFHGAAPREYISLVSDAYRIYPTVVHEAAHVLQNQAAARVWRGETGYRDAALTEGMAEFVAYCYGASPSLARERARRILSGPDRDKYLPLHGVTGEDLARFPDLGGMYALDASFVAYLVERYDFQKVMKAYLSGSYEEAFGESATGLEDDWLAWLRSG